MPIRFNKKGKSVQEFSLLKDGLFALQEKLPEEVYNKIISMENKVFAGEGEFMENVEERLKEKTGKYKKLILSHTNKDPNRFCYYCSNQIPHYSRGCRGIQSSSSRNDWKWSQR